MQTHAHVFQRPVKRIHDGPDVTRFLVSKAYRDIGLFILQLNHAMCPRTTAPAGSLATVSNTTVFTLEASSKNTKYPPAVQRLQALLARLEVFVEESPPDPGPRRFGNASFRTWHKLLQARVEREGLLEEYIYLEGRKPRDPGDGGGGAAAERENADDENDGPVQPLEEIREYFLGGFGSAQRLDYGTGHELSFLAFLGCLWKLGVFAEEGGSDDDESVERSIVLGVMEPWVSLLLLFFSPPL